MITAITIYFVIVITHAFTRAFIKPEMVTEYKIIERLPTEAVILRSEYAVDIREQHGRVFNVEQIALQQATLKLISGIHPAMVKVLQKDDFRQPHLRHYRLEITIIPPNNKP